MSGPGETSSSEEEETTPSTNNNASSQITQPVDPTQNSQNSQGNTQNSQPVDPTQNSQGQTQNKSEKKWKLKNAELNIIDVYPKKTSGSVAPLVIRMEIKLKNRAKEDSTKIVGEFHFIYGLQNFF